MDLTDGAGQRPVCVTPSLSCGACSGGEGPGGLWGEPVCRSRPQQLARATFAVKTGHGARDGREEAQEPQAAGSGETAEAGSGTEGSEVTGSRCAERGRSNVSSGSFLSLGLLGGQTTPRAAASCSPLESRPTTGQGSPRRSPPAVALRGVGCRARRPYRPRHTRRSWTPPACCGAAYRVRWACSGTRRRAVHAACAEWRFFSAS